MPPRLLRPEATAPLPPSYATGSGSIVTICPKWPRLTEDRSGHMPTDEGSYVMIKILRPYSMHGDLNLLGHRAQPHCPHQILTFCEKQTCVILYTVVQLYNVILSG